MRKIAILGDSISQGLGSKKLNYVDDLIKKLNCCYEIKNFAHTGTTIRYALEIVNNVLNFKPDIVFIFYGNVDAILRPNENSKPNFYKLLPNRYKQNGMLDPRPFYSKKILKRIYEKSESTFRYNIKKLLMKVQGVYSWTSIDEFESLYNLFIKKLRSNDIEMILISTVTIDDFYFPGSTIQFEKYNKIIEKIALENQLKFINLYEILKKYNQDQVYGPDHFHPNEKGYEIIADVFSKAIEN